MPTAQHAYPCRIVCLTEETTETLYLLGEQERIVGISGFTVRPPRARREKPKVSAFTSAKIDRILALRPDLVLGFSDLQADIAAELIRHGIEVHAFNQRSVEGILAMIRTLGALVGATDRAERLTDQLRARMDGVRRGAGRRQRRPRVFFEEWDEPLISGIGWVCELIGIGGGDEIFPELSTGRSAKERIVTPAQVLERRPDIIIGSWCGKRFVPARVRERPGFAGIPAVASGELHEIKSTIILQPGPAALTDGLDALQAIIEGWSRRAEQVG
jgi:iron complex transport system substrate-binding protein